MCCGAAKLLVCRSASRSQSQSCNLGEKFRNWDHYPSCSQPEGRVHVVCLEAGAMCFAFACSCSRSCTIGRIFCVHVALMAFTQRLSVARCLVTAFMILWEQQAFAIGWSFRNHIEYLLGNRLLCFAITEQCLAISMGNPWVEYMIWISGFNSFYRILSWKCDLGWFLKTILIIYHKVSDSNLL